MKPRVARPGPLLPSLGSESWEPPLSLGLPKPRFHALIGSASRNAGLLPVVFGRQLVSERGARKILKETRL